jgi:flagellar hook-associated protein 2
VAFTAGGADGTAQLGLAAGSYTGTDVAGTIGGAAATGSGQVLTASSGNPAAGLTLLYTGTTAPGAAGTATVTWGTGALMDQRLNSWTEANTGTVDQEVTTLTDQSQKLDARAAAIDDRMARRRATLLAQFNAMEVAISKLQSQSAGVLALLNQGSSTSGA